MKKLYASVDRIEEKKIAVLEFDSGDLVEIPVHLLPDNVQETDVLRITIEQDYDEKNKRLKEIEDLQNELLNQ